MAASQTFAYLGPMHMEVLLSAFLLRHTHLTYTMDTRPLLVEAIYIIFEDVYAQLLLK